MVSAYNTPWVICTKYVLSNYFTTLGIINRNRTSHKRLYQLFCSIAIHQTILESNCKFVFPDKIYFSLVRVFAPSGWKFICIHIMKHHSRTIYFFILHQLLTKIFSKKCPFTCKFIRIYEC